MAVVVPLPRPLDRVAGQPLVVGGTLLLIVSVLLLAIPPTAAAPRLWLHWVAIMMLAWWLPGVLLVAHWRLPKQDLPTLALLALGLGWCWMVVILLIVHWLPGPIGLWLLAGSYG